MKSFLAIDNRRRWYTMGKTGNNPLVLMMLHGFTESADDIEAYSGLNEVAKNLDITVIYPEGTGVQNNWNRFIDRDYNFLNKLIELYPNNKIVLGGFSDGGIMANSYAIKNSQQISGLILYATPTTSYNIKTINKYPVLLLQNREDKLVKQPHVFGQAVKYKEAGHEVEIKMYDGKPKRFGHWWLEQATVDIELFLKGLLNVERIPS